MADGKKMDPVAMNRAMGLNDDGSPKTAAAKPAAPAAAEEHPVLKAISDLKTHLSALLDPSKQREMSHGGKTPDQLAADAVSGGVAEANRGRAE